MTTAEEIRKHSAEQFETIKASVQNEPGAVIGAITASALLQVMQAAWEIAAQLAEANEEARAARELQKQYQEKLLGKQSDLQDHLRRTMPEGMEMQLPDVGAILDTPMGKLLVVEIEHNGEKHKGVRPISEAEAEALSKPVTKQ